jgi:hypothetical protein
VVLNYLWEVEGAEGSEFRVYLSYYRGTSFHPDLVTSEEGVEEDLHQMTGYLILVREVGVAGEIFLEEEIAVCQDHYVVVPPAVLDASSRLCLYPLVLIVKPLAMRGVAVGLS